MSGALKRLQKEYAASKKEPPPLCTVEAVNANDLYTWKATIKGPPESPYEGGTFKLKVDIPQDYPFHQPSVVFLTKIYHPKNVNASGAICLDVIKHKWTPGMTISSVLISVCALLTDPNPDDPLVFEIGQQYKNNREAYIKKAKEWTLEYAMSTT